MESAHYEGTRLYIVSTSKAMIRGLENDGWETYRNSRETFDLLVVAGCIDFAQCGGHCMRPACSSRKWLQTYAPGKQVHGAGAAHRGP